jgi:hypothetical protein
MEAQRADAGSGLGTPVAPTQRRAIERAPEQVAEDKVIRRREVIASAHAIQRGGRSVGQWHTTDTAGLRG